MKRRVILILIIVGVLGAVGAGLWWYFHRNTGWRVLARADLALRAKNFDRAIEMAKDFAAANPSDFRGPYMQAQALIGLGRYEEARTMLGEAARLGPDRSEIPMALADTYAHPARQALAADPASLRVDAMRAAIEQIGQARDVLDKAKPSDPTAALDIKAALGLIEVELGFANRTLSERLKKEADIARGAGAAEQAAAKAKAAEEATAEAGRHLGLAKTTLSEVVARDAELGKGHTPHERAANTLVRLCLQDKDSKTLADARKAILALENPPPLAAMLIVLDEADVGESEEEAPANREKLQAAAAKLDEILKQHPDHPDAIQVKLSRADLAIRLGDFAKTEEICNAILETDARQAQARLLRASALTGRGNLTGAEQELFALKTDFPQWPQAHFAYALAAMKTGKKELAKEALRRVTQLDPTHAGALIYLADDLVRGGFYDQAFAEAKALYAAHPDNPMSVRLFAEAAARTDQANLALEALKAAEKKAAEKDFPQRAAMQLAVAEGYALLGNAEGATRAATAAAGMETTTLSDQLAVAQALLRMGRTAEAEGVLGKAAAAYPQSAGVRYQMGELYAQTNRLMQAIDQYQGAVQLAPQNTAYRLARARALLRADLLDECEAATRELLGLDPSNAEATLLMAQIKILRGESLGASPAQEEAAGKQKGLPLALAYLNHGEPDKCRDACQAILKEKPNDPDAGWLLGQAYLALGKPDDITQCIEQWKKVIEVSPDRLLVYRELGRLLSRDKPPKEVEGTLAAIAGAKTEMVDSAMAWLFQQKRLFVQAAEVYARLAARASASEDTRSGARLDRARCLAMAGRTDQAITELDLLAVQKAWRGRALLAKVAVLGTSGRASETEPILQELQKTAIQADNALFLGRIGIFYLQIGQAEKALKVAEELERLRPKDPQPCLLRAAALSGLGRGKEAIDAHREAIARQPGDLSNQLALVRALESQGELKAALDTLTQLETYGETGQMLALAERATLLTRWGLHKQAIEYLAKLAERSTATSPQVRLGLGQAFARLGQTDKARAEFQKVPKYASQYFMAQQALAELAETDDQRLTILRGLQAAKPDLGMLVAQRMDILLRADRAPEAVKEFQDFTPTLPPNVPPPEPLAVVALQAMLRAGDLAKAAPLSVQMAAQSGSPAWKRTAVLLTMDDRPDKARSILPDVAEADAHSAFIGLCLAAQSGGATKVWTDRLAKIDQQFAEANPPQSLPRTHKVLAALAVGNIADAEKQLAGIIGDDLLGTTVIGELVSSAKARPEARAEAVKLLKASVASDLGLSDLARRWALELMQARPTCQWAAALAANRSPDVANLRKVLALLKPDDCVLARMIQAAVLKEEAQYEKAAEIYRLAAAAERNNPQLIMNQAIATEGAGQFQEALALYRKVWETAKDPTAANNAAYITSELYAKDKDKLTEAAKWVADAVKAAPTVAAFRDTKGWLAYQLGNDQEARDELRRAVRGLPDSPEVHYHLGMVEKKAGNKDFALWHFEATVSLGEGMKSRKQTISKAAAEAVRLAREALAKPDGT